MTAYGTLNPANLEHKGSVREVDSPVVITVYGQAGAMAAGASQLVELKGIYDGFIIIL